MLAFSSGTGARTNVWTLKSRRGDSRSVKFKPIVTSTNFFVLRDLAIAGRGLALLPRFQVRAALAAGDLIEVLKDWSADENPFS